MVLKPLILLHLQICKMYFGSWAYDVTKVDVQVATQDQSQYLYGGHEWKIISYKAKRDELSYDEFNYPFLSMTLKMKRISSFYKYMFVGPTVLIALTTLFVFLIPPSSGERFILCEYS